MNWLKTGAFSMFVTIALDAFGAKAVGSGDTVGRVVFFKRMKPNPIFQVRPVPMADWEKVK